MFTRRSLVLTLLIAVPLLIYLGLGAYALWKTDLFTETFWILPVCWGVTWGVATLWKPAQAADVATQQSAPHFTARDQDAQKIVRKFQEQVDDWTPEQLTNPHFYLFQAQELAKELAAHYHPKAKDPLESLTVPEVLAAVRLAVDDLEYWMLTSVPGSQLLTIKHWKWLQHAPKWVERAQNAAWAAGILINPANILKYVTSRLTITPVSQELQTEFLAAVYLRFIRQTGFYLIEMNSGRLRGGADRYRRSFAHDESSRTTGETTPTRPALVPESLTIALVGQVKTGKSSLINALTGRMAAKTDVLPETSQVTRYRLDLPETDVRLTLLDTPGYADVDLTRKQMDEITQALRESDVVLFVVDAHSPAHDADRKVMDKLKSWHARDPALQPSPILVCLTHIDLLSPMLEWDPPYRWRDPKTKKEHSIRQAVDHLEDLFGPDTEGVVPLCTDVSRNREFGIAEELLPALVRLLPEGKTAALLKAYHRDLNADRFGTVLKQIKSSGKNLLRMWVEERLLEKGERGATRE